MDFRPSENLERMRGLLARMEQAVDSTRNNRTVTPATPPVTAPAPAPAARPAPAAEAPRPIPFSEVSDSGKPKARAKSLEDFEAAFQRLSSRQAS